MLHLRKAGSCSAWRTGRLGLRRGLRVLPLVELDLNAVRHHEIRHEVVAEVLDILIELNAAPAT